MTQVEQNTIVAVEPQELAYGQRRKTPSITRCSDEFLQITIQTTMLGLAALELTVDGARIRCYRRSSFAAKEQYRDQFVPLDPEVLPSEKMAVLLDAFDQVAQSGTEPLATAAKRPMVEAAIAEIDANRIEAPMIFQAWGNGDFELTLSDYQKGRKLHTIEIRNGDEMSIYARRGAKLERARPAVAQAIKAAEFMFSKVDTKALWDRYEVLRADVAQELDAQRANNSAASAVRETIEHGDLIILNEVWDYTTFGRTQVVFAKWKTSARGRNTLHGLFIDENGNPASTRVNQKQMKGARKLTSESASKIDHSIFSPHATIQLLQKQVAIEERRTAQRLAHAAMVERCKA